MSAEWLSLEAVCVGLLTHCLKIKMFITILSEISIPPFYVKMVFDIGGLCRGEQSLLTA